MVVKAATKKRLMDMGMPFAIAHWLADDRLYRERLGQVWDNTPILLLSYQQWNELIDWAGVWVERLPSVRWINSKERRDEFFMNMNEDRIRYGIPPITILNNQQFINWIDDDPFEVKS